MALLFRQLFESESSTFTYLVADTDSREAVLIDPVLETFERDLRVVRELELTLKYVVDTHVHADHVTAAGRLREATGARTVVSKGARVDCADQVVDDGDEIRFGTQSLRVLATPGHTDSCMSLHLGDRVFTGDCLLVRGTGRTDFQQGSSEKLYRSITDKLFRLPDETLVYPAHDYKGCTCSSIGEEKKHNPRIGGGRDLESFVKIMSELRLAQPKKIHEALPANLACGRAPEETMFKSTTNPQGIPEVSVEELRPVASQLRLIDVRRPEELVGELGHIEGVEHIELGPELMKFLETGARDQKIVFVCRSGARSGQATMASRQMGFTDTYNMEGGMLRWNEKGFPIKK